jgi:exonuclease SbcC
MRDSSAQGHRTYISNEAAANLLESKESELVGLRTQFDRVCGELAGAEENFKKAADNYDPEAHAATKAALNEAEKQQVETRTTLLSVKRRADELSKELERLGGVRTALQDEFREKDRLEKIGELNSFIRDTLKEAAPRVARNYVYHVSLEANQLFREICGDAEKSLKWTDDYGICVEEGGYERPFASLSGGEQMAAALSVRLALLKQLSDIRMAFFDEPTTNMDAERRENLAMQISQIKHFDQLFVISHDDTFEGYVDNVISVVNEQAE